MLIKYIPLIITSASIIAAIGFHWFNKPRFLMPSFMAASVTGIVSYALLSRLPQFDAAVPVSSLQQFWNNFGFAFCSGFVIAVFIGYLMKYVPDLFGDS